MFAKRNLVHKLSLVEELWKWFIKKNAALNWMLPLRNLLHTYLIIIYIE